VATSPTHAQTFFKCVGELDGRGTTPMAQLSSWYVSPCEVHGTTAEHDQFVFLVCRHPQLLFSSYNA